MGRDFRSGALGVSASLVTSDLGAATNPGMQRHNQQILRLITCVRKSIIRTAELQLIGSPQAGESIRTLARMS